MNIILATIFAHLMSDFIIQSDKTVEEKAKLRVKGIIKHFLEVLIPLFVVLQFQFKVSDIILYSLLISAIHIIIDMGKVLIQKTNMIESSFRVFIIDQLIHVFSVILIIILFNNKFEYNDYFGSIATVFKNTVFNESQVSVHLIISKIELYSSIYILFGVGAGIFIGNFLKPFKCDVQDANPLKAGKYIGIFERFIIITLTILSQFSAIAFIVAAKSLARHEDLNKRGFAEYYLLGTLLSIITGITGGLLSNYIIPFIQ